MAQKQEVFFVFNSLGGKGWGGAHRVACILANYLARRGYFVTVIVWRDTPVDYPLESSIIIKWLHHNIKRERDMLAPCIQTRRILKGHKGAFVFAFMSRMTAYAVLYTMFLNVKVIGAERTDPRTEPRKAIFRLIRNMLFCFPYKLVFQTPEALSYFPEIAQKKGSVIPNMLTPGLPQPCQGPRRTEFVTFCRIDKQKNLPMMIDAFLMIREKHPDFTLRIYGTGLIEDRIEDYIYTKRAAEYIFMEGFCKDVHHQVIDSYGFLSSSDYEGLSNSMIEAMAIGLPCICTDCPIGGAKMMIQDGVNGLLVPVGDVDAMVSAMEKLISSSSLRSKLSKNAVKIREALDEKIICEKWEKLMTEK